MRLSKAAWSRPLFAIAFCALPILGFLKVRRLRLKRRSHFGSWRRWLGEARMPLHLNRGICENALVIHRDRIEREVIDGLQREVLREDVAAFALEEFKWQLRARLQDTRSHLAVIRQRREKLKSEIANLARAIAEGHHSPALLAELGKRERELDGISEELLAADGRGLDALLLADVARAKAELSKHCRAIMPTRRLDVSD